MTKRELNPSYVGPRHDLAALVPPEAREVLDVGCSVGTLGELLQQTHGAHVTGIEIDARMAGLAAERLDRVLVGDVESLVLGVLLRDSDFDCLILGDVLEHLRDPWDVLRSLHGFLRPGGCVVASIPNVRHYTTVLNLVRGSWPYRDRGIHDRSHLRFFTLDSITAMFSDAGLEIEKLVRKYRIIERPHRYNKYAKYCRLLPLKEFFVFQYLLRARKLHNESVTGANVHD